MNSDPYDEITEYFAKAGISPEVPGILDAADKAARRYHAKPWPAKEQP